MTEHHNINQCETCGTFIKGGHMKKHKKSVDCTIQFRQNALSEEGLETPPSLSNYTKYISHLGKELLANVDWRDTETRALIKDQVIDAKRLLRKRLEAVPAETGYKKSHYERGWFEQYWMPAINALAIHYLDKLYPNNAAMRNELLWRFLDMSDDVKEAQIGGWDLALEMKTATCNMGRFTDIALKQKSTQFWMEEINKYPELAKVGFPHIVEAPRAAEVPCPHCGYVTNARSIHSHVSEPPRIFLNVGEYLDVVGQEGPAHQSVNFCQLRSFAIELIRRGYVKVDSTTFHHIELRYHRRSLSPFAVQFKAPTWAALMLPWWRDAAMYIVESCKTKAEAKNLFWQVEEAYINKDHESLDRILGMVELAKGL
ncbi:hypothetical protein HC928_02210 [bacterium]|nr:hypothetical protein [bacterium]